MANELTHEQRKELNTIMEKHSAVFSDVPGKTHLIEHEIKTNILMNL